MSEMLEIPWHKLSSDALQGLLEELVTRDGTDYGEQERSTQEKAAELRAALQRGRACIAFCPATDSWSVVEK